MTIKLPVDVNTLDDEILSLLIDESQKALDERKKYVPFVGEIIEVWDGDESERSLAYFDEACNSQFFARRSESSPSYIYNKHRRLDPTRILQFRDHEPGPCPCHDEEWIYVMYKGGVILRIEARDVDWSRNDILRWCPAVGVE